MFLVWLLLALLYIAWMLIRHPDDVMRFIRSVPHIKKKIDGKVAAKRLAVQRAEECAVWLRKEWEKRSLTNYAGSVIEFNDIREVK